MAARDYNFAALERKWQASWDRAGLFTAGRRPERRKLYLLCMYPYPSGALHMGHVMNYTLGDVLVRYYIMRGWNVFSPMGWDSFGLPAENAAIKLGIHPEDSIRMHVDKMREQMKRAGWGYDWSREIATSHPGYYKWTQWLFLQFYRNGHAIRKAAPVNWCPSCNTVLANEQVHDGCCERCNTEVTQRDLEQWFFTMSRDAQRLLDNHAQLKDWPQKVIRMQEEWIGRSEGARVDFTIAETGEPLPIFTTRPDTLFGVTFMSLAPEHPLIEKLVSGTPREEEVMKAVAEMRQSRERVVERERAALEKVGVWTGAHVINPVNGEKVQLWVANFALMSYGTGAVMAVPAHDQRDFEFAKKYDLPIRVVIQNEAGDLDAETMTEAYVDPGVMVNSGPFDGVPNEEGKKKVIDYLAEGGIGEGAINYRLRDWLISRQRYWGAPIPIVYCDKCGIVPVPEKDLPVLLPREVEFRPTGESPLAGCDDFVNTACPQCGGPARRETDTMDTFVDSSWYYLRYCSPRDDANVFAKDEIERWCPVDFYIGGIEHATMHLIYVRYFAHVLYDLGHISFEEPAVRLFCQGMVCKTAWYCPECKWVPEEKVKDGKCAVCGARVREEMAKISKTKLNTVAPEELLDRVGVDALRVFILADTPPDRDQVWNDEALKGSLRYLNRLWTLICAKAVEVEGAETTSAPGKGTSAADLELLRKTHNTIARITTDIGRTLHLNTAIAAAMELTNAIRAAGDVSPGVMRFACESLLRCFSPFAPHICEELWEILGHQPSIFDAGWPEHDPTILEREEVTIPVQVNGKLRARITLPADASEEEAKEAALADEKVQEFLSGRTVRRAIVVPGRLVNIVA